MKSMFDPHRPAVFNKAASLRRVFNSIRLPLCLLTLTAPLIIAGGCQSQNPEERVSRMSAHSQSNGDQTNFSQNTSPLAFPNPLSTITSHEIIIASYNVENLFDQNDDKRNENYGDYRISPNPSGQASNYGHSVDFDSKQLNFTEVKIRGIRKTLLGISNQGPDIIGLVEVESAHALNQLLDSVRDLGYQAAQFSSWKPGMKPSAIGMGLLSKFPIKSWDLLLPLGGEEVLELASEQGVRPILKVEINVGTEILTVYVNHWKSKASPESARIAYANSLERDIKQLVKNNPRGNYIVLGDLNSAYNENEVLEPGHNDTDGKTGINDILKAGSDKQILGSTEDPLLKYNLIFEVPEDLRGSAWYPKFGWSSLDHIIIGPGLYDGRGLDYVDGTFNIADPQHHRLTHLFTHEGVPNRWHSKAKRRKFTTHEPGGYSDHLPLWAKFTVQQ